eukprot:4764124-Pleurochrysis_carterae.AAC.2
MLQARSSTHVYVHARALTCTFACAPPHARHHLHRRAWLLQFSSHDVHSCSAPVTAPDTDFTSILWIRLVSERIEHLRQYAPTSDASRKSAARERGESPKSIYGWPALSCLKQTSEKWANAISRNKGNGWHSRVAVCKCDEEQIKRVRAKQMRREDILGATRQRSSFQDR